MKSIQQFYNKNQAWLAVASGKATLDIQHKDKTLLLHFDFKEGGGFVVARRKATLVFPNQYRITFKVGGRSKINHLELKFEDASGENVWRWRKENMQFMPDGTSIVIQNRDIEFAWGPQGGGPLKEASCIEWAIVAEEGGAGEIYIEDVQIEDVSLPLYPLIEYSSNHEDNAQLFLNAAYQWSNTDEDLKPFILLNFQGQRELNSLQLQWGNHHDQRGFDLLTSEDGVRWQDYWSTDQSIGKYCDVFLGELTVHWLKIQFHTGKHIVSLQNILFRSMDSGKDLNAYYHAMTSDYPHGYFPRQWMREQSFWTSLATPLGSSRSLINEDGLIEIDNGNFSIEPFICIHGVWQSWAHVEIQIGLQAAALPLPYVLWRKDGIELKIEVVVEGHNDQRKLHLHYTLLNTTNMDAEIKLALMLRPFQVTPSWQSYQQFGGAGRIEEIDFKGDHLIVNQSYFFQWNHPSHQYAALKHREGILVDQLFHHQPFHTAAQISDPQGAISAYLTWNVELKPHENKSVHIIVHQEPLLHLEYDFPSVQQHAIHEWKGAQGHFKMEAPDSALAIVESWKMAVSHIMMQREHAAMQPGSRRYKRCWIRDAAGMSAAMLRFGNYAEVKKLLLWYVNYIREDGYVPCCVDEHGADPLVEHDSHGQWVYIITQYYYFSKDKQTVLDLWPSIENAISYLDRIREHHLLAPSKGLLPVSASHEGYMAHHVHSYWDNFWALRGIEDGSRLADRLGYHLQAKRWKTLLEHFSLSVGESLTTTIQTHQLNYIPGSVEWADFDASATANGIDILDQLPGISTEMMHQTLDIYLKGFRERKANTIPWKNYTAYEIRIIPALLRLGRSDDAHELIDFFRADCRPQAWHQWPEITWHKMRSPGHLGDVPHTWISAEFAQAARCIWVYERYSDQSLVIAAGIKLSWLKQKTIRVSNVLTPFGTLHYELHLSNENHIQFTLHLENQAPEGGIYLQIPAEKEMNFAGIQAHFSVSSIQTILTLPTSTLA